MLILRRIIHALELNIDLYALLTLVRLISHAYFSRSRMGNIHGWGGPIPDSWMKQQVALQHKILSQMTALDMIPVTPVFAGHVPQNFNRWTKTWNTICNLGICVIFQEMLTIYLNWRLVCEVQINQGVNFFFNINSEGYNYGNTSKPLTYGNEIFTERYFWYYSL